jgi:hypothetical protein
MDENPPGFTMEIYGNIWKWTTSSFPPGKMRLLMGFDIR